VTSGERQPPGGAFADPDLLTGRLFFAVPVPAPSRAPLEEVLPELERALPAARFPQPGGWHLTLAFLGQVRAEHSSDVLAAGETAAAPAGPARLRLDGAGSFPSPRRARVLWTGVAGDVEVLAGVAARLSAACRDAGLRYEERAFAAHLTLARLPVPAPLPPEVLDLVTRAAAASPAWRARELCCYRSTLTNRGARYQVVRSFPLTGGAGGRG
jgi:RNA 2',3'-cyclic 3'-phosphodiesterase